MQMKRAIIVFTRAPVPGQTKTRLMPAFGPRQCARLHTCFLRDIQAQCKKIRADVFVSYTPRGAEHLLYPIFGKRAVYLPQKGEDIWERMCRSMETVLQRGYGACVLIGTDIPEIRAAHLAQAFDMLKTRDVIFGPSSDGGYYLVGMKRLYREAFVCMTDGQEKIAGCHILDHVICHLSKKGIVSGTVQELSDMDTQKDLQGYRERMRKDARLQKTETGKYLMGTSRISVIVPIYNEEKTIEKLQRQLAPYLSQCEIIFVDGGSTDRTIGSIKDGFRLLHSAKGRAAQMNLGAKESHGDILFFLHCDSELPRRFPAEIRRVMKDHRAGCFGIAFHSRNFFMFTCRVISNHRVKDRKVMFGDQGIFIDRDLFFEVGMFPDLPIMEDYQFSLTLKDKGVRLGMARRRIYTSDRRFPKGTIPKLRLMWKMNRLRKMYRDQAPIEKIADRYRDIR